MMRGQITVSFTWIFAAVAGIAIFGLLINFALTEESAAETRSASIQLRNLDTQLQAATATDNTVTTIENAPDIHVRCEGNPEGSVITADDAENLIPTTYRTIFAPRNLSGTLTSWTNDWSFPRDVARFQYLADDNTLFVIHNDSSVAPRVDAFLEQWPDQYNTLVQQGPGSLPQNYDTYHHLYFDNPGPGPAQGNYVWAKINNNDISWGRLIFNGNSDVITYAGEPLLYGAVFAGTQRRYLCNADKARKRVNMLAAQNYNRTWRLMQSLSTPTCGWNTSGDPITSACDNCLTPMYDALRNYSALATTSNIEDMVDHDDAIQSLTNTLEVQSCPDV
jgi:hypothetical protein